MVHVERMWPEVAQGGGDQADGTREQYLGRVPRLEGGLLWGHPECLWDSQGDAPGDIWSQGRGQGWRWCLGSHQHIGDSSPQGGRPS